MEADYCDGKFNFLLFWLSPLQLGPRVSIRPKTVFFTECQSLEKVLFQAHDMFFV